MLEALTDGCKKGDRLSQEKLYKYFYPPLFNLCKLFFDDNHEALSALNNGMLRVYKNIHLFYENKGTLFNWMYSLVRNEALTQLRNNKRIFKTCELPVDINFSSTLDIFKRYEFKELHKSFYLLPQSTRAVCKLFYLDDFSVKEISEVLEISDGTVKWHLSEGRKKLKLIYKQSTI
jgi:RNA polymerase sigma-70 factor (ECF subfamily)